MQLWVSSARVLIASFGLLSPSNLAWSFTSVDIATDRSVFTARRCDERLPVQYSFSGDQNDAGESGGGSFFSSNRSSAKDRRGYAIPLIGPIPNAKPLLPCGGEMSLDPPTPLQWKALEESVVVHRNFLRGQGGMVIIDEKSDMAAGVIDAAPLVAVIDDITGLTPTGSPGSTAGERGRYATLAAVVGIKHKGRRKGGVRDDGEESFFNSLMQFGASEGMISPFSSNVRLIGVGRAILRDFFYRTPSLQNNAESGNVPAAEEGDDDDEDEWDDGYADSTPVVMAEFTPLRDLNTLNYGDSDKVGNKGARSARSSPVHSVAETHRVSAQVRWMHDGRRRLAAGLTAAKARLELRGRKKLWEEEDSRAKGDVYEYDDYDGLGLIGSSFSSSVAQGGDDSDDAMTVEELLIEFQGKASKKADRENISETEVAPLSQGEARDVPTSSPLARIVGMENYGLNYYSYLSSIPDLTTVAIQALKPYYSREHREREEHELEVFSFVAFRALEGYADPIDMAWALHCQSTLERLQRAYDIMLVHRRELEGLAEEISQELTDCGEECTDLW